MSTTAVAEKWEAVSVNGKRVEHLYVSWPSGIYKIRRKIDGKVKKSSLETKEILVALERYRQHPLAQKAARFTPESTITCDEAFAIFIARIAEKKAPATVALYAGLWEVWCKESLGHEKVRDIDPEHIIFVLERMERVPGPRGKLVGECRRINCQTMLSSFFRSCTERPTRYRDGNPVTQIGDARITAPEQTEVAENLYLSNEQIDAIAAEIGKTTGNSWDERVNKIILTTLVKVLPEIGTRISEALGLEIEDFRPLHGELHVEKQRSFGAKANDPETWHAAMKGQKGVVGSRVRTVPLTDYGIGVLRAYIDLGISEGWLRRGGLLFPSTIHTMRSATRTTTQIREAGEKAIGRRVISHHFRHTFASTKLEQGYTLDEVAEMIGDTPETTRRRYAKRVDRSAFNARIRETGRKFEPAVALWPSG